MELSDSCVTDAPWFVISPATMADVFISYKREDSKRIEPLIRAVRAAGYSVWWDQGIEPGEDWFDSILEQLDRSKITLGIWSTASIDERGVFRKNEQGKSYVRIEHNKTKPGRLIPVLLDDKRMAVEFDTLQVVNLVGWRGDVGDARCVQLINRAHALLGGTGSQTGLAPASILTPPPPVAPAFRPLPGVSDYLSTLRVQDGSPLRRADFDLAAAQLGCEVDAVRAAVEVESGRLGAFAADGRPIILFEPHIFSRRTNRKYDTSHPAISYRTWDVLKYPRTQGERWSQLEAAYALDPQHAIASASYGLFQIMGFNHAACGFADPKSFVTDMSKSQAQQLKAFTAFVRANNLADELVRKDWDGFARGYNGPGQVERYGGLLRDAYARFRASS